jgi:hypothetical protein
MQLIVKSNGAIRCLYDETVDLSSLGSLTIQRGSLVEPDTTGRWLADLAPVDGPVLGPFNHRSEALAAEREWLERNWLCQP